MNIDTKNIMNHIKKMRAADIIYPSIFTFFFIATAITFFFTVRFISTSINDIFSNGRDHAGDTLNREHYLLVAKKLNIPLDSEPSQKSALEEIETIATTTATTTTTIIAEPLDLNKKAITILVKNSTAKKGVAAILAKALENDGFDAPKTGNETENYDTTTILIKEGKQEYTALLTAVITKTYPSAIVVTTPDSALFDATIIIGEK